MKPVVLLLLLLIPVGSAFAQLEGEDLLGIEAVFVHGTDIIDITGFTTYLYSDVTFIITSPNGNIVEIGQISPDENGMLETQFIVGETWQQDGDYIITASQGYTDSDLITDSITVEILEGVVVPEFGMIAMMIFMVAITSIVILTRSKIVKY
jgi:predicted secreted protein with PEFG-CTERM motif|tara:strand:+ start:584 stop:1039 length:456 start_codon:yes stop_codon:yes gene_type:complete